MEVKLNTFEGPLDLLLYLIEKNEMDIYDIPIAKITTQYMEYVNALKGADLNNLSDFLVMAATLLDIKSRFLLPPRLRPQEETEYEEEDPREALVKQLVEYRKYKQLGTVLREKHAEAEKSLYRMPSIPELENEEEPVDTTDLSMDKLKGIFEQVMRRQKDKIDPVRSKFGKIKKEEVTLEDKMTELERWVKTSGSLSFQSLLEDQSDKEAIVVTFLAMLELVKMGKVTVHPDNNDIQILKNVCAK